MKLEEIAELLHGEVVGPSGAREIEITGASGIDAVQEGEITFLASPKLLPTLVASKAAAVLVKEPLAMLATPQVKVQNPHYAFAQLLSHFYIRPHAYKGVSEHAFIGEGVEVGNEVTVYPFAYVGDKVKIGVGSVIYPGVFVGQESIIGKHCTIHPNVSIYERTRIGSNVIIHAGSVIGADGFGYVFEGGVHHKIPQVGNVVIEDNVEIGANVTIDRATTGKTVIGKGTKIDNLVQVAHNVEVGKNVILVAQVGIAGSSCIGDQAVLGGQVGVADHTSVEPGTMIGAQSGVMGEVKRGIYSGTPIFPHREWLKASALFQKLPEMKKKLQELEQRLAQLEGKRAQE